MTYLALCLAALIGIAYEERLITVRTARATLATYTRRANRGP